MFLSLAWLLRRTNADATADHLTLRQTSSTTLSNWAQNPGLIPHHVDNVVFAMPTLVDTQKLANAGEWGEAACAVAIVESYAMPGTALRIHILGPGTDEIKIHPPGGAPAQDLYIVNIGLRHYRALWPANDCVDVPPSMLTFAQRQGWSKPRQSILYATLNSAKGASFLSAGSASSTHDLHEVALEIRQLDVGQGDSAIVFLIGPEKQILYSALIDTGDQYGSIDNAGAFAKHPTVVYIESLIAVGHFRPFDAMLLSHWDSDHMGASAQFLTHGLKYFGSHFMIYDPGDGGSGDSDYGTFQKALDAVDSGRYTRLRPTAGTSILSIYGVQITCVASGLIGVNPLYDETKMPRTLRKRGAEQFAYFDISASPVPMHKLHEDDSIDPDAVAPGKKNNASLGWAITFGNFTFFTAGDLEGVAEAEVIRSLVTHGKRHVCAWKLSHHGSHHSTTSGFLASSKPRFGVISCGKDNKHGHPGRAVIPRIADLNKSVHCTVWATCSVTDNPSRFGVPDKTYTFDNHGHVVVHVTAEQAHDAAHRFSVASGASAWTELSCGGNRADADVVIGEHEDLMEELDEGQKRKRAQSGGRKKARAAYVLNIAKNWLDAKIEEILNLGNDKHLEEWLKKKELFKDYEQLILNMKSHVATTVEGDPDQWDEEQQESVKDELHESFNAILAIRLFLTRVRASK